MLPQQTHRPDPRYKTLLATSVLLIFLVGFAPFGFIALAPDVGPAFLRWFLLGNALWIALALLWVGPYMRSITYELGERELIVRRGVLTKSTDMVPYHMITNVALRRGILARMLGLGKLKIHTAGYSQSADAEATIVGVANYEELREAIIAKMRAASGQAPAELLDAPSGSEQALLAALLEEVRGLRAVLDK